MASWHRMQHMKKAWNAREIEFVLSLRAEQNHWRPVLWTYKPHTKSGFWCNSYHWNGMFFSQARSLGGHAWPSVAAALATSTTVKNTASGQTYTTFHTPSSIFCIYECIAKRKMLQKLLVYQVFFILTQVSWHSLKPWVAFDLLGLRNKK